MRGIGWTGPGPSRALVERLKASEIAIDREERSGLPLVVATAASTRVPAARAERGRWIWLSATSVAPARATDAVLRGPTTSSP